MRLLLGGSRSSKSTADRRSIQSSANLLARDSRFRSGSPSGSTALHAEGVVISTSSDAVGEAAAAQAPTLDSGSATFAPTPPRKSSLAAPGLLSSYDIGRRPSDSDPSDLQIGTAQTISTDDVHRGAPAVWSSNSAATSTVSELDSSHWWPEIERLQEQQRELYKDDHSQIRPDTESQPATAVQDPLTVTSHLHGEQEAMPLGRSSTDHPPHSSAARLQRLDTTQSVRDQIAAAQSPSSSIYSAAPDSAWAETRWNNNNFNPPKSNLHHSQLQAQTEASGQNQAPPGFATHNPQAYTASTWPLLQPPPPANHIQSHSYHSTVAETVGGPPRSRSFGFNEADQDHSYDYISHQQARIHGERAVTSSADHPRNPSPSGGQVSQLRVLQQQQQQRQYPQYHYPHYHPSPPSTPGLPEDTRPNVQSTRPLPLGHPLQHQIQLETAPDDVSIHTASQGNSNNAAVTSNTASSSAARASRAAAPASGILNRQSVQMPAPGRDQSSATGGPAAAVGSGDGQRGQAVAAGSNVEMTREEIDKLVKDHKELREKYTKVKKYYFEKEDQVKQLQNSLAHQRLSQSRTSLDDSEYATRFNRLDGLVAQLAYGIRREWRSVPAWLAGSVNHDAVAIGKKEMTAVGRAFISNWLVEEVFDRCFHPDLEPSLSAQLRSIQSTIRRSAAPTHASEDEDSLTSKIINWRLATLEGLQEALRSPQCPANRAQLTDMLQAQLYSALAVHLTEPPPPDLEGGVHMIIELAVTIAVHLPLESRDVAVEYFSPGYSILPEQMKIESGIPSVVTSVADNEAAERGSIRSTGSDAADGAEHVGQAGSADSHAPPSKKRSMLSALTGGGLITTSTNNGNNNNSGTPSSPISNSNNKSKQLSSTTAGANQLDARTSLNANSKRNGSSSSLSRPDSSHGPSDSGPGNGAGTPGRGALKDSSSHPRVRMAAGIAVYVRGRVVLVKAPIYATSWSSEK